MLTVFLTFSSLLLVLLIAMNLLQRGFEGMGWLQQQPQEPQGPTSEEVAAAVKEEALLQEIERLKHLVNDQEATINRMQEELSREYARTIKTKSAWRTFGLEYALGGDTDIAFCKAEEVILGN